MAEVVAGMYAHTAGVEPVSNQDRGTQVSSGDFGGSFSSLLTKDNVNSFTGLPSLEVLNALVSCYEKILRITNKHQLQNNPRSSTIPKVT